MTCCVGRARIYFREPINYWLTYQLPNGNIGSVTALEPLTTNCISEPTFPGDIQIVYYFKRKRCDSGDISPENGYDYIGFYNAWTSPGSISTIDECGRNSTLIGSGFNNLGNESQAGFPLAYTTFIEGYWGAHPNAPQPLPAVYTFKVIGTETDTVYAEIGGLEECPTVISNICLMGEERYIDQLLPDQSPGGPVESSCFVLDVVGNDWRVDLVTTYRNIDNRALRPAQRRNVLYLTGLPGCPPEYRVECCGLDQCEPEEQCPPDTDCSLECDGLVCCYKNGRVIRSFRR